MSDVLFIKTFGGLRMQYKDHIISEQDNRSKKVWALLEYVIVNHNKEVSTLTIMDLLWPEESNCEAPMNALKVCLYRAREVLSKLNYPEKQLLLHKHNSLFFNPNVKIEIDFELFEAYCKKASLENEFDCIESQLQCYEKALSLYQGDLLPKVCDEDWAIPIIYYYHSLYIKTMLSFLTLLYEQKDYEKLVMYSYQAIKIDELEEKIHYYLILGLFRSGKAQAALTQYENILRLLYNDFGINPSEELKALYQEIIKAENSTQVDLNIIQQDLVEKQAKPMAYECDYSIFQHLYQIQARSMERTGLTFFLCLLTLKSSAQTKKGSQISTGMDRLSRVLAHSLRCGDVFSRYSKNQYIVLLPSASYENSTLICERILKNFERLRPKISINISYKLRCMEPQIYHDQSFHAPQS